MLDNKKLLIVTLTEPVVFLRSSDPSGRHSDSNDPPTVVRGVLTLNVPKPMGISCINVELSGVLTTHYSDGIASRRTDIQEKQKIYSSTVTVFHTGEALPGKASTSVEGPSLSAVSMDERPALNLSLPSSSPRGRSERPNAAAGIRPDLGPTPPYSPMPQSPVRGQPQISSLGHGPNEMFEELGQVLRVNLGYGGPPSRPHSIAFCRSNSTAESDAYMISNEHVHRESDNPPAVGDASSTEELSPISLHQPPSPTRPLHPRSHSCPRRDNPDLASAPPARSRFRLSVSSVLDTVLEVTSKSPRGATGLEDRERGRARVRAGAGEHLMEITGTKIPRANACPSGRERYLLGLGRVLGLERDNEKAKEVQPKYKDRIEGCREFKPGTYSYPISFLLPSNLPPTFSAPRGSLDYTIKAVAHRPGTFTSKLSCQVPLLVVAAPTAGAGEGGVPGDPGPLNVQRQWEGKLAYSFELSSRLFLLGSQRHLGAAASDAICATESLVEIAAEARADAAYGTAVLNLTLLPLEKVKVWRLGIFVDQRISYFDGKGHLRDEDERRVKLLEVQDKCLLEELGPADEEWARTNKHAYVQIPLLPTPISPDRSPLLQHMSPSVDPSILAGPGPYTLSTSFGLPRCGDRGLRFSMKHKSSYVRVEHSLRLVMRVQSTGNESINAGDGKKKCFDITVQTPVTILSCRCVPEQQALPLYSECPACPCKPGSEEAQGYEDGNERGARTSFESEGGRWSDEGSRSSSRARGHVATFVSTPQSSRAPSPIARYERLVSGLESEAGEAPPSYESVVV